MSNHDSPLRYPGGKGKMSSYIASIISSNNLLDGHYIEPYAGGAAIALSLLFKEYVKKITINDYDKSIYSFWYSVLNDTDRLCNKIQDVEITVDEWNKQKSIQKNKHNTDHLTLGFSTFFLNRTNRSGIIKAGIIGGKEQKGKWKIDARFNKEDLIKRIIKISKYSSRINLHNEDTIELIKKKKYSECNNSLIYFDPPYYIKGKDLYTNFYKHKDHSDISKRIKMLETKWLISYDNTPEIQKLYSDYKQVVYNLNYSAFEARKGNEVMFFSDGINIPFKYQDNTTSNETII